jgi:hypothetical protein
MAQQKVDVVQDFAQPVSVIFAELVDHQNLSKVFGIPVQRIRDGAPGVNGVGSIRRLGAPLWVEETVVALVPDQSIDYEISKNGGPVRNHHGRLQFSSLADGGSRVQWLISFDALPGVGALLRGVLTLALRRGLKRLR